MLQRPGNDYNGNELLKRVLLGQAVQHNDRHDSVFLKLFSLGSATMFPVRPTVLPVAGEKPKNFR